MKDLLARLPDIITAAASSPLGVIALMAIALSVLAYLFFRRSHEGWRLASLTLLFLGCVAFGATVFREAASESVDPQVKPASHAKSPHASIPVPSDDLLRTSLERWIVEAERARAAGTIAPGSPLPTDLSAARNEFEAAWRQAPLGAKKQLNPIQVSQGLEYLNRLYRVQEKDSPTQTNANTWADEAIRFFEELQDRTFLTDALLDKAAIYLDIAQLGHSDKSQFEQTAKAGDAVMVRAYQTASTRQKPEVLRLTSRFYYNLARPKSFRLSDTWDNNYLLLAYQKVKEAYDLAPSEIKNANQLARTVIKTSKNPPQDRDPEWTKRLRSARDGLKRAWEASKDSLAGLDERLSPLNVLGVVTLETVAREWRDLEVTKRTETAPQFLAELETDALTPLREAAALLQNSELRTAYRFDLYYDLARALAVKTAILQMAAPQEARSTFEELKRNLSIAKEAAKTPQLEAALEDLDREIAFTLLSIKQRQTLARLVSVSQAS